MGSEGTTFLAGGSAGAAAPLSQGMTAGPAASPYFWAGLAALFFGLSLAAAGHWIVARPVAGGAAAARRSAFAAAALALAVLSAVGLLVFPPKASLGGPWFFGWVGLAAVLGVFIGLKPRAGLVVLAVLALAAAGLVSEGLRGYSPLTAPAEVARILPLSGEGGSWKAELVVDRSYGRSRSREIEIHADTAALAVELLEPQGPLTLFVPAEWYRVVGIVSESGEVLVPLAETRPSLAERLAPLPPGSAMAPRGLFLKRRRSVGPAVTFALLETVAYCFNWDETGPVLAARADEAR